MWLVSQTTRKRGASVIGKKLRRLIYRRARSNGLHSDGLDILPETPVPLIFRQLSLLLGQFVGSGQFAHRAGRMRAG